MKKLLSFCLALFLTLLPCKAVPEFHQFVAVIASSDISHDLDPKKWPTDDFILIMDWRALPKVLDKIASDSGDGPIFIDFLVHGSPEGLFLHQPNGLWHRTSFGYVISEVDKRFHNRELTLTFESCRAGYAYYNTIRGNSFYSAPGMFTDVIADYPTVPPFPVYCANVSWDGIGPLCYLEVRL